MDANDRQAIEGLFQKLDAVERASEPRDPEAEALIRERLSGQPASPYYMLQTIVVQEQALEAAQARIEALEREAARRPAGGQGLFASLFGQGAQPSRGGASEGPWSRSSTNRSGAGRTSVGGRRPGGGFLAGAAQTAMGVAGGVLLGNAIAGMLADDASAADAGVDASSPEDAEFEDRGLDGGPSEGGDLDGGGFDGLDF